MLEITRRVRKSDFFVNLTLSVPWGKKRTDNVVGLVNQYVNKKDKILDIF